MDFKYEILNESHNCSDFDCGNEFLNQFLIKRAKNEASQRLSKTRLAINDKRVILGFYSLCPSLISKKNLASEGRGVIYEDIPAIRIGRLAVDKRYQKLGIGKEILKDAFNICLKLSNEIGGRVVVVDAKDVQAASFYSKYGFKPIKQNPLTLVLKISTIEKASA